MTLFSLERLGWSPALRTWALLAALIPLGACGGGLKRFPRDEIPEVLFFELRLASRAHRLTEPYDAVTAYLQIENLSDQPIELYQLRAELEGNIRAITLSSAQVQADIQFQPRPEYLAFDIAIPSHDTRVVEVPMALLSAQAVSRSSGPLVPSFRGRLQFHTRKGDYGVSVYEKLSEPIYVGEDEEEEDE